MAEPSRVDEALFPRSVVGCPDPHVERWCMADPASFQKVVGASPLPDPGKCDRGAYKNLLRDSLRRGGQPILTDPMEFAPDLVREMDFYRAGKNLSALRLFVEDLRKAVRSLSR